MFRALIAKDLRRARRNPLPWLINLLVPLCIVGLIGAIFGSNNRNQELGRVRFAVVDEDHSRLIEFLRGSLNQGDAAKHLDPVFLDRAPALAQLNANELSAVVILPKDFTAHFLSGEPAQLELIKNPAQSIQPTVVEELLGILTAAMNGITRNLAEELPLVRRTLEGDPDYRQIASVILRIGDRVESIRQVHTFPLVSYESVTRPGEAKNRGPGFNLFGYLLAGMAAMFLLFLANTGMSDLHREVQLRTLERYATHHVSLAPFIAAKVAFVVVMLVICAAILLGGGGLAFRVSWQHPVQLGALVLTYALFAAGLMALLVSLFPSQRRSDPITTMVNMGLGVAGGCAFPPQQLPPFVRQQIMPLLPTAWFSDAVRTLEFAAGGTPWSAAALKLLLLGVGMMAVAALFFRRRFAKGLRA